MRPNPANENKVQMYCSLLSRGSPASTSYRCWDPTMAGIRQGGQGRAGPQTQKEGRAKSKCPLFVRRPLCVFALQRPRNPGADRNQERGLI